MQPETLTGAAPASAARELVRFDGAVQCRADSGAVGWSLYGVSPAVPRAAARATELLFSGVSTPIEKLPQRLHDVRIVELEEPHCFRIEAREGRFELSARSVQRHSDDAAPAFFGALPRRDVPLLTRWGWSLLLGVLRARPLAQWIARRGD